jgi:hypothetical protein
LEEGGEWADEGGELAKDVWRRVAGGAGWIEEGTESANDGRWKVGDGAGGWNMVAEGG